MEHQGRDFVSEISAQYDELFRLHRDLLKQKNILRKQDLIEVIKLDLDKLTHALVDMQDTTAMDVLRGFFAGTDINTAEIDGKLQLPYINHVGFEIYEPLDLTVFGIQRWVALSRTTLGARIKIQNSLRFPASAAFQERVGAYTEIMRIGLLVNERMLMLELFDIRRPLDDVLKAGSHKLKHRNFHGLFRAEESRPGHRQRLAQLFSSDQIWHYAFHLKQPEDVRALHDEMLSLAAANPVFRVPYAKPVHNEHDRSLHTKIISQADASRARTEIEFVTELG